MKSLEQTVKVDDGRLATLPEKCVEMNIILIWIKQSRIWRSSVNKPLDTL